MVKNVKIKINIGKENIYDDEDISSIIEKMENIDYFDIHLVYKLHYRVVDNPYIIEKKIIEYFNKFFYLLKSSSGAYVEIIKINIILENMI